jgi:hypothetical protein
VALVLLTLAEITAERRMPDPPVARAQLALFRTSGGRPDAPHLLAGCGAAITIVAGALFAIVLLSEPLL